MADVENAQAWPTSERRNMDDDKTAEELDLEILEALTPAVIVGGILAAIYATVRFIFKF